MTYGKIHRFFLRTVASQGVISIADAQAALERFNDEEQLLSVTDLVKLINDEIRPYYQEIKITQDEITNEDVVVFISLADDAATKAQNIFSSTELEYFRVLIEHIMSTESRQITKINAMNLVSSMKSNFTKTDAQKVLNTWCRMRYFDKVQDNYALGVRAIHEFEGYFQQNMPHAVEECFLCKHIVFRGYNCPGCAHAVHTKCLLRYIERVQKWPCCKIDFAQEQLDHLDAEGARLSPTQALDTTRQSEENNTLAEPTQAQESSEFLDETQEVIPEISQRLTRKRKRQISPQIQVPITHSTSNDTVAKPIRVPTTHRSTKGNIGEELSQKSNKPRSTKENIVEEPLQVSATSHSKRNNTVAKPTQVPITRRSTRNNTVPESVTEVQESFNSLDMTDEVTLETTQRVTRKRKQPM